MSLLKDLRLYGILMFFSLSLPHLGFEWQWNCSWIIWFWPYKTAALSKNNPRLSQGLDILHGTRAGDEAFSNLVPCSSEVI